MWDAVDTTWTDRASSSGTRRSGYIPISRIGEEIKDVDTLRVRSFAARLAVVIAVALVGFVAGRSATTLTGGVVTAIALGAGVAVAVFAGGRHTDVPPR